MKKVVLAFLVVLSVSAFAVNKQEVFNMAKVDVMDTLGFDETVIKIEWMEFITVPGSDLAVLSTVKSYFDEHQAPATIKCVTTFSKAGSRYNLVKTNCRSAR